MKSLVVIGGIVAGFLAIARARADELRDQTMNEQRTILVSEIVTTSPQTTMRSLSEAWQKDTKKAPQTIDTLMRQLQTITNGGSNVFVVDATNLYDVLSASFNIFSGSHPADTPAPANTSRPKRGSHWLVVYLGHGPSNPTWWTIESAKVGQGKVVFSYRESRPRPANDEVHHYYFWVPLGKLDPGVYELELLDANNGAIALMRRIEVTANIERGDTQ